MKKLSLMLVTGLLSLSAFSAQAGNNATIPEGRVICQSESAMKTFLAKKKVSNKVAALPKECRRLEKKRVGELKKRYKGYVKIKTRLGDSVYVDKDAVRWN